MSILINALLLNSDCSGVQHSTRNLLHEICKSNTSNRVEVLLSKTSIESFQGTDNVKFKNLNFSTNNRLRRIYYEHCRLESYFRKNRFDLYHATSYIAPFFSQMRTVLTVHDLIALDYPQYCRLESSIYFSLCMPRAILNAAKIIAVSNRVKMDIITKFNLEPERIEVVYHGVGQEFKKVSSTSLLQKVIQKYKLPIKFILFVGNLEPKKNLVNLIRAFKELKKHADIEHKLVIAGKNGWNYEEIYKKVATEEMSEEIIFTGYIDQQDLPSLYSLSDLFVFPSLYEGFGLPVLEAMACETPVLISNRGALPEIAGEIETVDPLDIHDIALKIFILLTNIEMRSQNIAYGIKRITNFSWAKCAKKTLEVYDNLLAIDRGSRFK